MPSAFFRFVLVVTLAFAGWAGSAHAQDGFDDEFDDEFADEFDREAEAPTPQAAADAADDEFADEFEADLADAEADGADIAERDDEDGDEPATEDEELRARLFRSHNSWFGPVGGLRTVDAASAAVGTFRVQLLTEFFTTSGFIVGASDGFDGDSASHIGGSLSLNATVHENIELWVSIQSYANSNDQGDPTLFQVLGDAQLGIKAFHRLSPVLSLGGDLSISLLNTVGDIGLVFKSTSFGIRANMTADFRGLDRSIPLVIRFNAQYYFDNSAKLITDVEQARYDNLEDPMPDIINEDRHLITTIERFGLNINRTDFLNLALGFEAPFEIGDSNFHLSPIVEWTWGIPINRQGYSCLFIPGDSPDEPAVGADGCLDKQGISSFPMSLSLGVRVLPPVEGLSFLVGADVGLTGTSTFVRELAPNMPWNILLGLSYAYDTVEPPAPEPVVREVERRVEVNIPPPLRGRVKGLAVEQGTETAIANAIVTFPGQERNPLVTSGDGRFTTYLFDPGEVQIAISHPEYNAGTCSGTIPDERPEEGDVVEVEVRCELEALPRVGSVAGRVVGDGSAAIAGATIQITGAAERTATAAADGTFALADLPPGEYTARVEAEDHLIKLQTFTVAARAESTPTITMIPRPRRALVTVRRRSINIRRKINFVTDSAEIESSSEALMSEIADVLIRNPNIQLVEIQGHTDNRGGRDHNIDLSQRRSESVRQWLINHGVAGSRLEARGFGPARPLVPNITPANRARNRRVQFEIKEQAE